MVRVMVKQAAKVGGYSVAMLSCLLFLATGETQAAEKVRLIDGSFNAAGSWGQWAVFTPPSDGKLVLTFENPDSSADSNMQIAASKPTDYYPSKLWERPVLTGYTFSTAILGKNVKGFPTNTIEFSAYQSWGQVSIGIQYDSSLGAGIDNTGTDRVTLDFVPTTIESTIPGAQYLTRLVSQPYEANETSINFTAVRPGKLILKAVREGSGGGAQMVYVDGYGIGGIDTGEFGGAGANYKTLQLREAGNHLLKVSHEDSYFYDNSGVREVEVYFLADAETDKTAPVTIATVSGTTGGDGWLLSDAAVSLAATDDSSGVKEIHYSIDNGAETIVAANNAALAITSDGIHAITYYAVDKAGNSEAAKTLEVKIDRTVPTLELSATPNIIWPRNHKLVDVTVNGSAGDSLSDVSSVQITVTDSYGEYNMTVPGFGSTVQLEAWCNGTDKSGRTYTITAVVKDKAGNTAVKTTNVVVPHDNRN
jgi:hypothetical protein